MIGYVILWMKSMWAIVSTSNKLKFYSFEAKEFITIDGLDYLSNEFTYQYTEIEKHNFVVSQLLSQGLPIYINKSDARVKATSVNLTGYKYLQLNPTILKI